MLCEKEMMRRKCENEVDGKPRAPQRERERERVCEPEVASKWKGKYAKRGKKYMKKRDKKS